MSRKPRREFTQEDDNYLAQYIAKYYPEDEGRQGNVLYERLVRNAEKKWPWSKRHPAQSWRERYKNNKSYIDKKIHCYQKKAGVQPSLQQGSAPPPLREKLVRTPFTEEDDGHIVEFLAEARSSQGARLGEKLWRTLEDYDEYPWAERHPWMSWRERYKKNEAWFDWAVYRHQRGEDFDEPPPRGILKPKTSDAPPLVSVKRRRGSDAPEEAPPKKKTRVQEQPEPGPSRRAGQAGPSSSHARTKAAEMPAEEEEEEDTEEEVVKVKEPNGRVSKGGAQGDGAVEQQDDGEEEAVEEVIELDDEESGEEEETSDEEDEEDDAPIDSDSYRGAIFQDDEDAGPVEGDAPRSTAGSSEDEDEILDSHDPHSDVEHNCGAAASEELVPVETNMDDAEEAVPPPPPPVTTAKPVLSDTPPSGALPPRRKPNTRIQHDIDAAPDTPALSPTVEAEARHHRERSHTPGPTRKHVKRISRHTEDIFGTPKPESPSASGTATAENSPTARHVAHMRDSQQDVAEAGPSPPREPPRLDEGAWNKALSDEKGKARVDPAGKSRRPSGVNFEDEVEVIETQDSPVDRSPAGHDFDEDEDVEEEAPAAPIPWPPNRSKRRNVAPATPMRVRDDRSSHAPSTGRVVTTERTITVQTTRTVERKIPRQSRGTPFPRAALLAAAVEDPSSPIQPPADDTIQVEEIEMSPSQRHPFSQSQHHPFSQPIIAPSMNASSGTSSTGLSGASRTRPVSDADLALLEEMLGSPKKAQARQPSPSKARQATVPQKSSVGTSDCQRPPHQAVKSKPTNAVASTSRLGAGPPRAGPSLARATMSPPIAEHDNPERFAQFEERDQELAIPHTSPLAPKRKPQRQPLGEIHPVASTSTSRPVIEREPQARPSKSKQHARRHTLGGPLTPDVFYDGAERRASSNPRPSYGYRSSPFSVGDSDLSRRTTFGLLHRPPPPLPRSGSGQPHAYSFGTSIGAWPSPTHAWDASFAETLGAGEQKFLLALGMQTAVQRMAENHSFGEETVRQVCAETRSLEGADRLLHLMREGANRVATEELQSIAADAEDEDAVQSDEEQMEVDDYADDEEMPPMDRNHQREEAEVEDALVEDSFGDDPPLAESSRVEAHPPPSRRRTSSSADTSRRKSQQLIIEHVPPDREPSEEVPDEYSPPKRTGAASWLKAQKRARLSSVAGMDVDAAGKDNEAASAGSRSKGKARASGMEAGDLLRLPAEWWSQLEEDLGPEGVKRTLGLAMAPFLK